MDPKAKNPKFRPAISRDQEKANLRILELFNYYKARRRNNTITTLDKSYIHSRDAILISRMDGMDTMIMLGSGGRAGHTYVCSWMNGELYVFEAQAAPYWLIAGLQKNKFGNWI